MAYFSSGTEAMRYQEEWCGRCAHFTDRDESETPSCPVLDLHWLWNNYQHGKCDEAKMKRRILLMFIPEVVVHSVKYVAKCAMFHESSKEGPSTQLDLGF